ncbi:GNAT family N-acetyltransferase [Cryptosporangium sp. NPDC048952]|uniref:GNAT family N-acetyltransferase n=1 Tax=Cryptosporangium sp. NPDC048952 TaxID=3363961 RepID=UPI0037111D70
MIYGDDGFGEADHFIRGYRIEDAPAVHKIEQECFDGDRYPLFLIIQLGEIFTNSFLIAGRGTAVVGYAIAVPDGNRVACGWILSIAVLPEHRRIGIGNQLLAVAEEHLRSRGCTEARTTVRPGNIPSQCLFRRRGYLQSSSMSDYFGPGEHRLLLAARLK